MKYSPTKLQQWPRLIVEKTDSYTGVEKGYLQLNEADEKVEIGTVEGNEFRLIQCLFSPQNFPSARYQPVAQSYERLYSTLAVGKKDLTESFSHINTTAEEEKIASVIEKLLKNVAKSAIGKHLAFIFREGTVHMSLHSPKQALS